MPDSRQDEIAQVFRVLHLLTEQERLRFQPPPEEAPSAPTITPQTFVLMTSTTASGEEYPNAELERDSQ